MSDDWVHVIGHVSWKSSNEYAKVIYKISLAKLFDGNFEGQKLHGLLVCHVKKMIWPGRMKFAEEKVSD